MRKALLWLALSAVTVPATAEPPAELYFDLKQARITAYKKGDRAFFEQLLSEDFVGLGPDGKLSTKADYLADTFHGDQRQRLATETTVSGFNARYSGDMLVMTYEEVERSKIGDSEYREHLRRLDTYQLQDGRWRLRSMTAVRVPEAPQAIFLPAATLGTYAGSYLFGPGLTSVVRLSGGKLLEQTSGQAEVELIPIGEDTFYAPPDLQARVLFERDAAGKVVAQVYQSGSQKLRAPMQPKP